MNTQILFFGFSVFFLNILTLENVSQYSLSEGQFGNMFVPLTSNYILGIYHEEIIKCTK